MSSPGRVAWNPAHAYRVAPFLTAEWRHLLMINYATDRQLLQPHVPARTELDCWRGTTYLSVVGFLFLRTRVRGCPVPGHRNFEEVNLRFYVRRKTPAGWRRGVVFLKELVPRRAIAIMARRAYREPYEAVAMSHSIQLERGELRPGANLEYAWRYNGEWHTLGATVATAPQTLQPRSEVEFITEHYWGYTQINDRLSSEYQVEHPKWQTYSVMDHKISVRFGALYGVEFGMLEASLPQSIMLAEGSVIAVRGATKLK